MSLGFNLCFEDLSVAFRLVKVLRKSIQLLLLIVELNSVPHLDVLLNFHPQYVRIQGHRHFIGQTFYFLLLLFNGSAHVPNALLHIRLNVFARLHLFS